MQARLWITILPRSISAAAAGSSSGFAEQRLGSTDHRYIEAPISVEFVIDVLVDHGKRRYVRAAGTDRGEAVDRQHDQYDRHYSDRADRTGTPECGIVENHISILPSSKHQPRLWRAGSGCTFRHSISALRSSGFLRPAKTIFVPGMNFRGAAT